MLSNVQQWTNDRWVKVFACESPALAHAAFLDRFVWGEHVRFVPEVTQWDDSLPDPDAMIPEVCVNNTAIYTQATVWAASPRAA